VEAASVLRLIVDFHSPTADSVVIPALIETLRTENADNRLRINQTLLDLQKADFPSSEPDKDLSDWVPKGRKRRRRRCARASLVEVVGKAAGSCRGRRFSLRSDDFGANAAEGLRANGTSSRFFEGFPAKEVRDG
jgi:hypothetical protein